MSRASRTTSERDSLTLNVWTPESGEALPVLFWVHGGALTSGSGGWDWYNGARLAAANQIVIVTMNYRLGPLGFLHPGDLNRNLGPGNLGILDVMLALEWTASNIAAFGGDPETITVGGQSAGAHLAGLLAASSRTRSMVRRLILQSGGLTSKVPSPQTRQRLHASTSTYSESTSRTHLPCGHWTSPGSSRRTTR